MMKDGAMCMLMGIADMKVGRERTMTITGTGEEGIEPRDSPDTHILNKSMKHLNQLTRLTSLVTPTLLAGAWGIFSADLHAAEPSEVPQKPVITQRLFASPDEAAKALQAAAEAKNKVALREIFGPEFDKTITGDKVQDANNAQRFAAVLAQGCQPVKNGEDKVTLEIGTNNYPMAVPLVKADGQWHFDMAAGKEEIINRHIGKDELNAIGFCRSYVVAQGKYASANPISGGGAKYAQKLKSTPGMKDGLYWPAAENEPASPFGPLVAEAHAEGYGTNQDAGPHPFHGYYFRILTQQGKAAPGEERDYMSRGDLTGGFALVAYPEIWDQSGIMTFIVNQDGKIYQQDLGATTSQIAGAMKEYNPDSKWTLAQDEGVLSAVSEK
jgi:hypothetical protein